MSTWIVSLVGNGIVIGIVIGIALGIAFALVNLRIDKVKHDLHEETAVRESENVALWNELAKARPDLSLERWNGRE